MSDTPRTDKFASLQRTHREWIEHSSTIERELAAAIRERDNANERTQRAWDEIQDMQLQRDQWFSVVISKNKQLGTTRELISTTLREVILADSLNDARTIAREALANIKP